MLCVIASLLFAGRINTTELLNLDFYSVIGVTPDASQKKILQQYKKFLDLKEKFGSDVTSTMEINMNRMETAFYTLGYEDSRALYDFTNTNFLNFTGFDVMGYQSDMTLDAIAKLMGQLPPEMAKYGGMISYPIQWDILDFMTGAEKELSVIRHEKCVCPKKSATRCEECKKSPYIEKLAKVTVKLPPGAPEYYRTISKGAGDTTVGRGASDVIFVAYTKPDPYFKREGANIVVKMNVTLSDLMKSREISVENIDGETYSVDLRAWMQRGFTGDERIVGKGLPIPLETSRRGDLVVKLTLELPSVLTEEQLKIIEATLPDDSNCYEEI